MPRVLNGLEPLAMTTTDGLMSSEDKTKLDTLSNLDVQINGTSIVNNGVAAIPYASATTPGLTFAGGMGISLSNGHELYITKADDSRVKAGTSDYMPIVPSNQHASVFYGLAKAAGDSTQAASSNAVGTYTSGAKTAIQNMLSIPNAAATSSSLGLMSATDKVKLDSMSTDTVLSVENEPYFSRAVTDSLYTGELYEEKIIGGTVVWNQLVDTETSSITLLSGHKYIAYIDGTWSIGTSDGTAIAVTGGTDMLFNISIMFPPAIVSYIISLGSDGIAWFRDLFPETSYEYNAGSMLSVKTSGKKIVSKNIFSAGTTLDWIMQVNNGYIKVEDGIIYFNTLQSGQGMYYNTGWHMPGNKQYSIAIECSIPKTRALIRLRKSDDSGWMTNSDATISGFTYLSYYDGWYADVNTARLEKTVTIPECGYWILGIGNGNSSYNNTVQTINSIQVEANSSCTSYIDYINEEYPMSNIQLNGSLKLDSNNKLYYDGDTYEHDGKVTRKYQIIDLSTLSWTYYSEANTFYSDNDINALQTTGTTVLCNKYRPIDNVEYASAITQDQVICTYKNQSMNRLYIKDTNYNDATTFKAALAGVYLLYPVYHTFIEKTTTFRNPLPIYYGATESFIDTRDISMKVGHETSCVTVSNVSTASVDTNSNQVATTAYVHNILQSNYAFSPTRMDDAGFIEKTYTSWGSTITITTTASEDYLSPHVRPGSLVSIISKHHKYRITFDNVEYILPGRVWFEIRESNKAYCYIGNLSLYVSDVSGVPGDIDDVPFLIISDLNDQYSIDIFTPIASTHTIKIEKINVTAKTIPSTLVLGDEYAPILRKNNDSSTYNGFSIGANELKSNRITFAMGYFNRISAEASTAIGLNNVITNSNDYILGTNNIVNMLYSVAIGDSNLISSTNDGYYFGLALGTFNKVRSSYGTAIGYGNDNSGVGSIALGYSNTITNNYSMTMGTLVYASGAFQHVFGVQNVIDSEDAWVASTSYAVGDRVSKDNKIYRCTTANSDATFNLTHWASGIGNYIEILGNGDPYDSSVRSNARATDWSGNTFIKGNIYVGCNADSSGGTMLQNAVPMTGATSSAAGTAGLVPAPTTGDVDKFLAGDGTYKSGGLPMVILSYGSSTWAQFEAAYNNNVIVYTRASSNSNPATGSQTRMAFMAYVNNATTPTEVEFQYYRSMSSHSATAMGDQVFIYKLTKTGGWSVTTRDASIKQIKMDTGSAGSVSWSGNVVTLDSGLPAVTASDNGKILKVVDGAWAVVDP